MLVPLSQSALTEAGSVATTVHVGAALSRKSIITNVTLTWFEEGRPKRVGLAARLGRACEAGMAALILLAWRGKCISRRTGGGLRLGPASHARQWDWGQTWSGWNTAIGEPVVRDSRQTRSFRRSSRNWWPHRQTCSSATHGRS